MPCYLAVLKDFGAANGAPLSFPIAGWTLALDLPRGRRGLAAALDGCDELVARPAGASTWPRTRGCAPRRSQAMYPRLDEWREVRDALDPERRVALGSRGPHRA